MTQLILAESKKESIATGTADDGFAMPSNQFKWSTKHKKLLADYNANPFKHALALKSTDINTRTCLPTLATDMTDKPLTTIQEKWLAMTNDWLLETDDNFADYQNNADKWDNFYQQCEQDEDGFYRNKISGLDYLSTQAFAGILAQRLFPKLSLSKQISFIALRSVSKRLQSVQIIALYHETLRYSQAVIHQLKTDNPNAYQTLYQRHSKLHPEVLALFFCADASYPRKSFSSSQQRLRHDDYSHEHYTRALYLHHTDSTQAAIFSQSYPDAIACSSYKMADTLPPLLSFIASCEAANTPQLIVDLLDEMPQQQKQNRQLFKVLENFDHELYLDWLVNHSIYPEVAKSLSLWVNRYPVLTLSKLAGALHDNYHLLSGYPDFSSMTKLFIQKNHYYDKPKFDKLSRDKAYLIQLFTHMCADLRTLHPEHFERLKTVVAAQNLTYYSGIIAPIFSKISRVEVVDNETAIENQLTDDNLAQVSQWLITPPWLDKQYRLQAPKYADHITLALLPKPVFKSDGSLLPQALLENLIGILHKSDLKGWIKPLTDVDILQLLAPFTRDSLKVLGRALWDIGIREPLAWLMNEDALPFIHKYIFDNKGAGGDTDGCRLLIRMLTASITLWYDPKTNITAERITLDAHISAALEEMVYQLYKGKPRFRSLVAQMFDDIMAVTGFKLCELVDLAVPMLGFNVQGERVFHLNAPRDATEDEDKVLIVRLDAHLSPLLFDATGTRLSRFPTAKKGDDKARFKHVRDEIKTLKRQLAALYKSLNAEFTQDCHQGVKRSMRFMMTGFLTHPILRHYGQTLFWSLNKNTPNRQYWNITDTFIMTADGALTNLHYDEYNNEQIQQWLDEDATVVLTHPAYLSDADHQAARDMLTDDEIAQPIEQMSLPCLRPNATERHSHKITRFEGQNLAVNALYNTLNHRARYGFSQILETRDTLVDTPRMVYGLSSDLDINGNQRFTDPERFKIEFCQPTPEYAYCAEADRRIYFPYLDTPVQIKPIDITDKNPIAVSHLLLAITAAAS